MVCQLAQQSAGSCTNIQDSVTRPHISQTYCYSKGLTLERQLPVVQPGKHVVRGRCSHPSRIPPPPNAGRIECGSIALTPWLRVLLTTGSRVDGL